MAGGAVGGNANPIATLHFQANGLTVTFTDASTDSDSDSDSGDGDGDGDIVSRSWNFGDGTAASTATNPSHVYAASGTYNVGLKVTDNAGGTHTRTASVTVGCS